MAVTQYTGARYVPLIMGEWVQTQSYEPLSVVTYQGNSYTSKQSVPANIDITDEAYWAATGNYNAQIEQYRAEVQQFDERISDLEAVAAMPLDVYMFDGGGTDNFTCKLVKGDNANIMIDTGGLSDSTAISNWLTGLLNGKKLDALVITHFHEDHYENYGNILTNFCDSQTNVFVQMQPTSANFQYEYYERYSANVSNMLSNLGYPSAIVPEDSSILAYGDNGSLKLQLFNTRQIDRDTYDAAWANGGESYYPGNVNAGKSGLNNYSLITYVSCGGSSYCDTGDVEGEAQRLLASRMKPATVALNPHHLYNKMGYEEFYDRLMPKMWLLSNHFATGASSEETDPQIYIFRFNNSYFGRYIKWNTDSVNILTNMNGNVEIHMLNGEITDFKGHILDQDYNLQESTIVPHFSCILPPDIYNSNPYFLISEDFTLEYLYTTLRKHINYAAVPQGFYIPNPNSSAYGANCPFANAVRSLWNPVEITSDIFMKMDEQYIWHFNFSTVQSPFSSLRIFAPTGNVPANITFDFDMKGKLKEKISGTFKNGDSIPSSNPLYNYLLRSTIIGAKLSTGAVIPCIRQTDYETAGTNGRGNFIGTTISANGASIYSCIVTRTGAITLNLITIANGNVDNEALTITEFFIQA